VYVCVSTVAVCVVTLYLVVVTTELNFFFFYLCTVVVSQDIFHSSFHAVSLTVDCNECSLGWGCFLGSFRLSLETRFLVALTASLTD